MQKSSTDIREDVHTSDHLVLRFQSFSAFRFPPELPVSYIKSRSPQEASRFLLLLSCISLCRFPHVSSLVQTEAGALFFTIKALPSPQSTTHSSLRKKTQQTKTTPIPPVSLLTSKPAQIKQPSGEHGNPLHSKILFRIYPFHTREMSGSKPEFGVRNLAK